MVIGKLYYKFAIYISYVDSGWKYIGDICHKV